MTVKITCKPCGVRMDRLDWLRNKTCENPNCNCPEVKKLRQQTQEVIDKAKGSTNVQSVKRASVPTGYESGVPQYMIDIPDVMVIDVIVPKTHFGHKKGKK